jgi:phosphoribosyl 1,2-cyclic phosphate phosphodiesterase
VAAALTVTILGCGSSGGVPQIGGADGRGDWGVCDPAEPRNQRTRSAILVEGPEGGRLLVDAGPDLRQQFLACGVDRFDALLFTHSHADHVLGIDDLRQVNRITGRALPAYADAPTLENLMQRFDYAFLPVPPRGFFRPALEAHEVAAGQVLTLAGLPVELFRQDHKVMDTLGLRIGGFAYSTDVVALPEESLERLAGLDTWVVDCFQRHPHPVHAHLEMVLGWVERLRPRRAVLTHMGPDMDWAWLRQNLPPGIEPAHDGLVLRVPA